MVVSGRKSSRRGRGTGASRSQQPSSIRRPSLWLVAAALVLVVGTALWILTSPSPAAPSLAAVESPSLEGRNHVPSTVLPEYRSLPPTSGPHYDGVAAPGFHKTLPALGLLVHNLEHGHVVVYYHPDALVAEAREHLERLTRWYTGTWDAVLAVPWTEDPEYPLTLTAWGKRLRLKAYDPEAIDAFVDAYRGRGPENPVR